MDIVLTWLHTNWQGMIAGAIITPILISLINMVARPLLHKAIDWVFARKEIKDNKFFKKVLLDAMAEAETQFSEDTTKRAWVIEKCTQLGLSKEVVSAAIEMVLQEFQEGIKRNAVTTPLASANATLPIDKPK